MVGAQRVPAEYDAAIRELYADKGSPPIMAIFPHLSTQWICRRAQDLGLRRNPKKVRPKSDGAIAAGIMDDETTRFVLACDAERRRLGQPVLKYSDILRVLKGLGYQKVAVTEAKDEPEQ